MRFVVPVSLLCAGVIVVTVSACGSGNVFPAEATDAWETAHTSLVRAVRECDAQGRATDVECRHVEAESARGAARDLITDIASRRPADPSPVCTQATAAVISDATYYAQISSASSARELDIVAGQLRERYRGLATACE